MSSMDERLVALGERVKDERLAQRWTMKGASIEADVARDTWKRVEQGLPVHDVNRRKVLDFLGLDDRGEPIVVTPEPRERPRLDEATEDQLLDELVARRRAHPDGGVAEVGA